MMSGAHHLILAIGTLGLLSILAGLLSRVIGAPLLLVFLLVGMLAGQYLPEDIMYGDFRSAYIIGSIALAIILFEGGLKTRPEVMRRVLWPALALSTFGVVITAAVVGLAVKLLAAPTWTGALLAGAVVAPTDAAAVSSLLRRARVGVPERVIAVLEVESGMNDPASVFLTVLLMMYFVHPEQVGGVQAIFFFLRQMVGGAALGAAGGGLLVLLLRRLPMEASLATVSALAGALALFGLAQSLETSGFMAVYIAAILTDAARTRAMDDMERFFEGLGWLAQIVLFVMLGLMVTPQGLLPLIVPATLSALVLLFVARPVAVFACLRPFGFNAREMAFVAWVGLRGAVPIYLSIVPAIGDVRGMRLFEGVFVAVVASLILQGWTVGPAARLLGYGPQKPVPVTEAEHRG
jgi:cell volume regulation protein A